MPLVDRFHWSTPDDKTGLRIVNTGSGEAIILLSPEVTEPSATELKIVSRDSEGNTYTIVLQEDCIKVTSDNAAPWALQLRVPGEKASQLPFDSFSCKKMSGDFRGYRYSVACKKGSIAKGSGSDYVYRLLPADNTIIVDCKAKSQG